MENCLEYFAQGFTSLSWQQIIMMLIGILLIYLGIAKKYEPMLLIPIGFGAILVNLPPEILWQHGNTDGILKILFETGILNAEETVARLKTEVLHDQWTFHTDNILAYCKYVKHVEVKEAL